MSHEWLYFRIRSDITRGRGLLVDEIAPMVREVARILPIEGWWWLFKSDSHGPAIRLRVSVSPDARARVAEAMSAALTASHNEFSMPYYEPELLLFGGPYGIDAAHEFFCADSAFVASWAERERSTKGALIPEGLSLALVMRLLQAAGLDLFERWDVFHGVARMRVFGNRKDSRYQPYEALAQRIVSAGPNKVVQLYLDNEEQKGDRMLATHVAFLDAFGRKLSALYSEGFLECGLRELCVPLILFHWNRLLLSPFAHFGLSHAVAEELERAVRPNHDTAGARG
jgi:thiopeptide-type bacteriocin biosynthesis protein